MVFSSVPIYLDPPNWQQQQPNHDHHQHQHQHHQSQNPNTSSNNNNFPPPPPALPAQPPSSGGGGGGSGPGAGPAKPGSMAERARMAKIPQPETALKCPRCDSTNTKFCYYNNYSLTQPRHFCKTCRRYWTRGGALRTVPVGGGCRRNKRSKSSSSGKSKPSSSSSAAAATSSNSDRHTATTSSSANPDVFSHLPLPPPNFPFLPNLHHLGTGGSGEVQYGGDLGLSFSSSGGGGGDVDFLAEQWRINQQSQFPFMAGNILEAPMINGGSGGNNNMIYPNFDSSNNSNALMSEGHNSHLSYVRPTSASSKGAELAAVKVEGLNGGSSGNNGENQGINMSRNFLGVLGNNYGDDHYSLQLHGGNSNTASGNNIPWNTDLSSFTTTTSSNHTLI